MRLGAAELNPLLVAAGAGDNAAAALGLGARPGDVVVSIGTSGTVFACCDTPIADPTGAVAGFADATGRHLPLVCTLNAARVLDAAAALLGVSLGELSRLALSAPAGADGLTLIPYLEGERTPNRPDATGTLHGLRLTNSTPAHLARAYIEGMLCGLADGLDALTAVGRAGTAHPAGRRRGALGSRTDDGTGGAGPDSTGAERRRVRRGRRRDAGSLGPERGGRGPGLGPVRGGAVGSGAGTVAARAVSRVPGRRRTPALGSGRFRGDLLQRNRARLRDVVVQRADPQHRRSEQPER